MYRNLDIRGLTEENTQWGIISPIGYLNNQMGIFYPIGDLFSYSALPDSEIPNPQLGILCPIGNLIFPIGDNMHNWGYFMLVVY